MKYKKTNEAETELYSLFSVLLNLSKFTLSLALNICEKRTEDELRSFKDIENPLIFKKERKEFEEKILKWLSKNLEDILLICDPYFCPEDMWLLKEINSINHNCEVKILTSIKEQNKIREESRSLQEVYSDYWFNQLSDQSPPRTEICISGYKDTDEFPVNLFPIHDRWLLTEDNCLGLGSSIKSMGGYRISEIKNYSTKDSQARKRVVLFYINRNEREKISYELIVL